jgi:hypothetical protein
MAMAIATAMSMRLAGDEEGKGEGCRGDGDARATKRTMLPFIAYKRIGPTARKSVQGRLLYHL